MAVGTVSGLAVGQVYREARRGVGEVCDWDNMAQTERSRISQGFPDQGTSPLVYPPLQREAFSMSLFPGLEQGVLGRCILHGMLGRDETLRFFASNVFF